MRWKVLTAVLATGGVLYGLATIGKTEDTGFGAVARSAVNQLVTPCRPAIEGKAVTQVEINGDRLEMRTWFHSILPGETLKGLA